MGNNKYKVLIVDDEAGIRSFMGAVLESNGYQVLTAQTCAQGSMMFASHCPDLIMLDLGLPDADGTDLIRAVRAAGAPTPILVLSARSDEADKITALDLGANDYITKPFGTGELLARVRAALRDRRPDPAPGETFHVRGLVIDYDARAVTLDGAPSSRGCGARRMRAASKSCKSTWPTSAKSWARGPATTPISATSWALATACTPNKPACHHKGSICHPCQKS